MTNPLFSKIGIEEEKLIRLLELIISKENKTSVKIEKCSSEEIFEKYRKNTSSLSLDPVVDLYEAHKYDRFPLTIKKYKKNSEKDYELDITLGKLLYDLNRKKNFEEEIQEHRFTGVAGSRRKINGFLKPLGIEENYLKENKIAVYKTTNEKPFYKRFDQNKKYTFWNFISSLDLPVFLHDYITPYFESQISRNAKLKKVLKPLELNEYTKGWNRMIKTSSNLTKDEKDTLSKSFKELAKEYMLKKDFETLIQVDGYPWHNDTNNFLDIGKIRKGARGMHLGALLGHPSIFNKMENPIETLKILLIETYEKFKRYELGVQFPLSAGKKLDEKILENSFYVGAICSNSSLIASHAPLLKEGEKEDLERTIKSQLKILKIKGSFKARDILEIINKKPISSWGYIENLKERFSIEDHERRKK